MCTAVKFGLPVVVVVMNNGVLGMVRQWQTFFYGSRYSSTTLERATDFVKLAEAFGAKGYRCHTVEELDKAMGEAVTSKVPVIIDAVIDKDENVLPMIPAGKTINDIITCWH